MEYKKNRKSRSACGWWVSMEMVYVQGPDTFVSMMYIWVPVQPHRASAASISTTGLPGRLTTRSSEEEAGQEGGVGAIETAKEKTWKSCSTPLHNPLFAQPFLRSLSQSSIVLNSFARISFRQENEMCF